MTDQPAEPPVRPAVAGHGSAGPGPAGSAAAATDDAGSGPVRTRGRALPRAAVILVVAAAFVVLVAGTREVSSIVAPAFFAFNLVLTTRPLQKWLLNHHVPRGAVVVLVMLVLYAILFGVFGLLAIAIVQAASEIPRYASQFLELFDRLVTWLDERGISQAQLLDEVQSNLDFGRIITFTQSLLGWVSSFSTQLGFIVLVLFFLAIDTGDTRRRLSLLVGARPDLASSLRDFATSVRRYWVVNTIFGLIVAVLDYVGLLVIGVPLAFTWGILAFVTNYIPNIGFVIGLVPPALVALLEGGVRDMVWVLVLYAVANTAIQTFIQPKFTSDAVGINTTTTFLSLAFWSFVLGPLGALVAVPATLFLKAVLIDSDPSTRWVNAFVNAETSISHEGGQASRRAGRRAGAAPAPPGSGADPPVRDGPPYQDGRESPDPKSPAPARSTADDTATADGRVNTVDPEPESTVTEGSRTPPQDAPRRDVDPADPPGFDDTK